MIYLLFFSLVLLFALGWQKSEEMEGIMPEQKEQESVRQVLDEPISVSMHYGLKMQDNLDLYIRNDGLLLCSQTVQFQIHRRDIVKVAINASNKEKTSLEALKGIFYNQREERTHYIVIGYKNAASKLKVVTLRAENLTDRCRKKLDQFK